MFLPRFTTFCIPLQPWPLHLLQMLRWETPLRPTGQLHLRRRPPVTTKLHNDSNYHFNHSTPGNTVYYNPTTVMDQLHITEHQTTTTPPLPDNTPYTQFFTALTLEEYQLLSQQQATPLAQLDCTRPFAASLETFGCPATTLHCSAFHYLTQPTSTTTTRLHSTLQLATTPTTSSSNYRLDNNYP